MSDIINGMGGICRMLDNALTTDYPGCYTVRVKHIRFLEE